MFLVFFVCVLFLPGKSDTVEETFIHFNTSPKIWVIMLFNRWFIYACQIADTSDNICTNRQLLTAAYNEIEHLCLPFMASYANAWAVCFMLTAYLTDQKWSAFVQRASYSEESKRVINAKSAFDSSKCRQIYKTLKQETWTDAAFRRS